MMREQGLDIHSFHSFVMNVNYLGLFIIYATITKMKKEEMSMSFEEYIRALIPLVGGEENIISATHCISRLRLVLKDKTVVDEAKVENLKKTIAISKSANQFQVVIGEEVEDAYEELLNQISRLKSNDQSTNTESSSARSAQKKFNPIDLFTETVSGIFVPAMIGILGCGIITGIQVLLTSLNLIQAGDGAYTLFSVLGDAGFYFLPFLLAVSSAERFGCNKFLSLALVGVLMHPTFTSLLAEGTAALELGGFVKLSLMSYSSTVLPAILMVYFQSKLEKLLNRFIPKTIRMVFVPLLVLIIVAPIALLVIGPVANTLSGGFAAGFAWFYGRASIPASIVLQALYPFLVLTGLHMGLFPINLEMLAATGKVHLSPLMGGANTALAACALAMYFRSKNANVKSTSLSAAFVTGVGITEPALYGVVMKSKRLIIITIVSGACGGLINGIFQTYSSGIGFTPLGSIPLQFNSSLPYWILSTLVTASVAFILTILYGWKDPDMTSKE